ncbi:MAG TPA: hypothetical protein VKV73_33405 [Chloroflexota bacterium]|nr:hypothetical protein [Chloroflexota bacterium]
MEPGDQHPQHTEQAKNQKRVVEPQPVACINDHPNECSDERVFECKRGRRHKRITPLVLVSLLLLTGCLPDPERQQTAGLLDQLVLARTMFGEQPPRMAVGCNVVGDVQTRLYGEPGLTDVRPAWPALRGAAGALQSICGRDTLLAQPTNGSLALTQARQRWEEGISRENGVACDYLRTAAAALSRPSPC